MNQLLLKAVEPYWIYDYEVAQKLDPDHELLRRLAKGLKLIQIRIKSLSGDALRAQAKQYRGAIKEANPSCAVIMNDHIDICQDFAFDGVHLGQGDESVVEARKVLGKEAIVGLTVRSIKEAKEASVLIEDGSVDYIGVGTVFETTTKQGLVAKGPGFIEEVFTLVDTEKVYPIGGINKDNLSKLKGIGVRHVALCSELYTNPELKDYCG